MAPLRGLGKALAIGRSKRRGRLSVPFLLLSVPFVSLWLIFRTSVDHNDTKSAEDGETVAFLIGVAKPQ